MNLKKTSLIFALALSLGIIVNASQGGENMAKLKGKKAVMIIAEKNFRDEELFEPKKILEAEGVKVIVASTSFNTARGMLGGKVKPDMLLSEIKVDDYDAIIFVGGSGASQYWNDSLAHNIAKEAVEKNKVLGAICIAPVTLANAGVLTG
ncbi:DJ-1/PfpI family protein, partial [Candidatus Aerophobetes bacterium]|nr:DJ-1/PfpI family protein [Candidatus Aerophobetes bacterium]